MSITAILALFPVLFLIIVAGIVWFGWFPKLREPMAEDHPHGIPPRMFDALAAECGGPGCRIPHEAFWAALDQDHPWLTAAIEFDNQLSPAQRSRYNSFWAALRDQDATFWQALETGDHRPWQQLEHCHHVSLQISGVMAQSVQGGAARLDDRGSVTAEMAVFAIPVLVLLAVFIVFCGRAASAAIDVRAIAAAGARAAADAPSAALAPEAASRAAASMVSTTKWVCTTATDTTQFQRGGSVTVTASCAIRLEDLGITGLEDTKVVAATAIQPVDTWRAGL